MSRESDPYMADRASDDDDSCSCSASGSDSPSPKRARMSAGSLSGGGFSGGFSATAQGDQGDTAESQLEAMLAAETPASAGAAAGPTLGGGMAMAGAGGGLLDSFGGLGGLAAAAGGNLVLGGAPKVVETMPFDSRLSRENLPTRDVPVPKNLVEYLMTPDHRTLLCEETGADVEWARKNAEVTLRGSSDQIKKATRILQRVFMHCHWGRSSSKVARLLRPAIVESAICRLSPMNSLRPAQKALNLSSPTMSIGKEKGNDVVIPDHLISRQHCVLELDPERGSIYAIDCSTNGTFLNGVRLPSKTVGKVLLSHGDELLFKDPAAGDTEFGYIVNLLEQQVKQPVKFERPRRLMGSDDMSSGRDFA